MPDYLKAYTEYKQLADTVNWLDVINLSSIALVINIVTLILLSSIGVMLYAFILDIRLERPNRGVSILKNGKKGAKQSWFRKNIWSLSIFSALCTLTAVLIVLFPFDNSKTSNKYNTLVKMSQLVLDGVVADYLYTSDIQTYPLTDKLPFNVAYGDIIEMAVKTKHGVHQKANVYIMYSNKFEDSTVIPFSDSKYEQLSVGEFEPHGGSSGGLLALGKSTNKGYWKEEFRLADLDYLVNIKLMEGGK